MHFQQKFRNQLKGEGILGAPRQLLVKSPPPPNYLKRRRTTKRKKISYIWDMCEKWKKEHYRKGETVLRPLVLSYAERLLSAQKRVQKTEKIEHDKNWHDSEFCSRDKKITEGSLRKGCRKETENKENT